MPLIILHSDLNNFYASVECLRHPELRNLPVAVGGDETLRHGIVLAKNQIAKRFGIKTGMALWQARQFCPGIVTIPADFSHYLRFSDKVRKIYHEYTDRIEPFGIDEAWLDISRLVSSYEEAAAFADRLRARIREELGVTVSIGVSFNKIFAKLGSDMKKPDATTLITPENFQEVVWPLPAGELLFVGRATGARLDRFGIHSIGDIAASDPSFLRGTLGKCGESLWRFASGLDNSPVGEWGCGGLVKSVGNSTTAPRDLESDEDVKIVFLMLSESVAARLREQGLRCSTVSVWLRDNELASFERQLKLPVPTCLSGELAEAALLLFHRNYHWEKPLRSIGVRGCDLVPDSGISQLSIFGDEMRRIKNERAERAVDRLRSRFGYNSVQKGLLLTDTILSGLNPKEDHTIHPVSYRM